jgi:peptide/nickel transport system substrate-binding protein
MRKLIGGARGVLAAVVLALAAAGCGDGGGEQDALPDAPLTGSEEQAPERGGTAVLAELNDLDKPIPLFYESVMDSDLVDVMYMALTRSAWRNGRLVQLVSPESPMAIAWRHEYTGPDSAAIRYRMRSALRWSDGKPLTARDVVWTFERLKDPRAASPRQQDVENIDSVRAENDSTVVVHFRRRSPDMLFSAAIGIVPRHVFEGTAPAQLRTHPTLVDPTKMVVSGPFRVGAWQPNQQITLVPNPHFAPRALLDAIAIRVIPEPTTRVVEFQTGQVDFARPITTDYLAELKRRMPSAKLEREARRYWEFVAYNPNKVDAFRDPNVRRALGMAVDVPAIVNGLRLEPYVAVASGPYPPIFRDLYDPQRMRPLAFDTTRARALLASAGWRDTDGDGILDKDGKKLSFTLLTNTGNQRRADVSQVIQQQWRRIGVDARIQLLEFGAVSERQYAKNYEALLGGWGVNLNPDLMPLFATESPLNIVSFDDPEAQRLMRLAKEQPTAPQANAIWRAAAQRIVEMQPYTWLYYYDPVTAVNARLRNVKVDTYGAYQNTWEWWIPRAQQRARAAAPTAAPKDSQ